MRKTSESTRHRLQFDPLEHRQLLSGGFPGPHMDTASYAAFGSAQVSGHDDGDAGWGNPASGGGPAGWGPQTSSGTSPGAFLLGGIGRAGSPFGDPDQGLAGTSGSGTPGYGPGWGASTGSPSVAASPPGSPPGVGTPSNPSGGNLGGNVGTTGGNGSGSPTSGGQPGIPGSSVPGGPNGGGDPSQSHSQPQPYAFSPMSGQPSLVFVFMMKDRSDTPEPGASPLNPTGGPGGPAMAAPVSAISPAAAMLGSPQGPPALPAQSSSQAGDPESPVIDRTPSPAGGPSPRGDLRGIVAPARAAVGSGHALLTSSPHSEVWNAMEDPRVADVPRPRGADLIAEALPLAGESLQRSLEEFVQQLKSVDVTHGPTTAVAVTLAVAGAVASAVAAQEVIRRHSRSRGGIRLVDSRGRELALCFPELPRSWSKRY